MIRIRIVENKFALFAITQEKNWDNYKNFDSAPQTAGRFCLILGCVS